MRLSVFVPTKNRPQFFNRLSESIRDQLEGDVEFVVSANGSLDGYQFPKGTRVIQQRTDIGGRVQWMLGPLVCRGDYIWMLGDDEAVLPGGIETVLRGLAENPGILVNHDGVYDLGVAMGARFPQYRDFVQAQVLAGRCRAIPALTLCAAMVFRRESFDLSAAVEKCDTMYGQHYAILGPLMESPIHVVDSPSFFPGSSGEASIYLESAEKQQEHMSAYPWVIYDIVNWVSQRTGVPLDATACWMSGDGFDSIGRPR
jgi:glycosyltransferase involved in cell wall biosynthesis